MNLFNINEKNFCLIATLLFINCSSTKTNTFDTEEWINSQNFTISKPNDWRPVKHHGYVGYTPIKKGGNFFNNIVSIFQYQFKEKPNSLKELAKNQMNQNNKIYDISSQKTLSIKKSKLGNVYTHEFESTWNGINYKSCVVYFEHNGEYYNYKYSSLKKNYDTHHQEAIDILLSIKFK